MRRKWCRAIEVMLAVLLLPAAADTEGTGAAKPLPEAIITAWKDAGPRSAGCSRTGRKDVPLKVKGRPA